jgi:hypothetical protein
VVMLNGGSLSATHSRCTCHYTVCSAALHCTPRTVWWLHIITVLSVGLSICSIWACMPCMSTHLTGMTRHQTVLCGATCSSLCVSLVDDDLSSLPVLDRCMLQSACQLQLVNALCHSVRTTALLFQLHSISTSPTSKKFHAKCPAQLYRAKLLADQLAGVCGASLAWGRPCQAGQ